MHRRSLTWMTTLAIGLIFVGNANAISPNEALPTNYDSKVSPGDSTGKPTEVKVGLYLLSFQVQEQAKTASVLIYFRQSWTDERLQFNQSDGKIYQLNDDDCSRVWLPDTFIATQVTPSTVDNRMLKVSPSGAVWYSQRLQCSHLDLRTLVTSEHFGMLVFMRNTKMYVTLPLTEMNELTFTIESFAYRTDVIVIKSMQGSEISFNEYIRTPRRLLGTNVKDCTISYTTGTYACLSLTINVARYKNVTMAKQFHVFGSLTLLVVALSWTAFWLSPSSTGGTVARVLIGLGTSILSFVIIIIRVAYMEQFGTSNSCDVLIGGCVLVVIAAVVESVVVIVLTSGESTDTKTQNASESGCVANCQWSNKQRRIDLIAKVVLPVVFGVFVIMFVVEHVKG